MKALSLVENTDKKAERWTKHKTSDFFNWGFVKGIVSFNWGFLYFKKYKISWVNHRLFNCHTHIRFSIGHFLIDITKI